MYLEPLKISGMWEITHILVFWIIFLKLISITKYALIPTYLLPKIFHFFAQLIGLLVLQKNTFLWNLSSKDWLHEPRDPRCNNTYFGILDYFSQINLNHQICIDPHIFTAKNISLFCPVNWTFGITEKYFSMELK